MAEKEVAEEKDTSSSNMDLLDRLGDIEVFRTESQVTMCYFFFLNSNLVPADNLGEDLLRSV